MTTITCIQCKGKGTIIVKGQTVTCEACNGTGEIQ